MRPAWAEYLKESNAAIRKNDLHHGMSFAGAGDSDRTTKDLVMEFMEGFGWVGMGAAEVTAAVKRDNRGVERALNALEAEGRLTVEAVLTRGPKASRRKIFYFGAAPTVVSLHEAGLIDE